MDNPYLQQASTTTGGNPFLAPTDGQQATLTGDTPPSGNLFSRTIAGVRQAAAERGGYAPLAADLAKTWFRQTTTALMTLVEGPGPAVTGMSPFFISRYGPDFRNSPAYRNDVLSGTANVAAFGVGNLVSQVPAKAAARIVGGAATKALVKGATFFGLEALGGATYGAIAPTPPGESKLQSIGENAALFAATAGVSGAAGAAARQARALPELLRGLRPAAQAATEAAPEAAAAAASRAPDALRSLSDAELEAQPLGATPPIEQSAAAPGAQEAQIARTFEERRVAEHPVDIERRRAGLPPLPTDNMNVAVREVAQEIHPLSVSDNAVQQGAQTLALPERGFAPASPMHDLGFPEAPAEGSSPTLARNRTLQRWTAELQRLSTEQLQGLTALQPGALGPALVKQAGVRIGATAVGLGALGLSTDDNISPADRSFLRLVGGAFVLGGTSRFLGARFAATGWGHQVLDAMNPLGQLFDPTLKRAATGSLGFYNMGAATRQVVSDALDQVIPRNATPEDFLNMASAIEHGDAEPAMATFTPAQQEVFRSLHDLHDWMGEFGKQAGFWQQYREDYFSLIFPKERLQRMGGLGASSVAPEGFLKQRADWDIRQATDWATRNGHAPPIADPRLVVPSHMEAFFRAMTQHQLIDHMTRLGALKPNDIAQGLAGNTQVQEYASLGWRRVENVSTLPNHLAPSSVASLLEHVSSRSAPGVIARAYDAAQSVMMRVIMWNAAIHGVNVLRGAASLDGGVAAYSQYWNMVSQADPVMLEAARSGAAIFGRSDIGPRMTSALDAALASARGDAAPTVGRLRQLLGNAAEWNDHILWNRAVPALGLHAWGQYMHDWAEQTSGKFTIGTPQYEGAARQAAEFANRQMGLAEPLVRSPGLSAVLRRTFFAPNWMLSRIGLMTNTYGQAADVLAGQVNPLHAAYLQQRLRMLAIGTALTYTGSMAMSGKPPAFNDQTLKFYMRTGKINPQTGRELGIDLLGWWQDDTKAFNNPLGFLVGKLNPLLALGQDVVSGRDFFGRQLSAPEQFVNIVNATPLGAAGSAVGALAEGNTANALRYGVRTLGVGGVAALPRPMDATIGAFAQRLLTEQGVPVTDDRTREVALLLRGNLLRGRPLISNEIIHLLANDQRQVSGPVALWMSARNVLSKWAGRVHATASAALQKAPPPAPPSSSNPFLAP